MILKYLNSKVKNFLKIPRPMKLLYIGHVFGRLNSKKRLVNIVHRLTNENERDIISTINRVEKSACLMRIINSYKEIEGALAIWELMFIQTLIYITKPDVFVETGVAHGSSSVMILEAMEFNKKGKLYSIDLPVINMNGKLVPLVKDYKFELEDISIVDQKRPTGWLVPQHLRHRWKLILGDSLVELPKLLEKLEHIDIFHHDSLHKYGHMQNEFTFVWPKIKKGGYLLSHDIFSANQTAMIDFLNRVNRKVYSFYNEGIAIK